MLEQFFSEDFQLKVVFKEKEKLLNSLDLFNERMMICSFLSIM